MRIPYVDILIEKRKLLRELYKPFLKIYTHEKDEH